MGIRATRSLALRAQATTITPVRIRIECLPIARIALILRWLSGCWIGGRCSVWTENDFIVRLGALIGAYAYTKPRETTSPGRRLRTLHTIVRVVHIPNTLRIVYDIQWPHTIYY